MIYLKIVTCNIILIQYIHFSHIFFVCLFRRQQDLCYNNFNNQIKVRKRIKVSIPPKRLIDIIKLSS